MGGVGLEKGVITVDSFDKLVRPALTGLALKSVCVCVLMSGWTRVCSECLYCVKGEAGLGGGQEKVQS